MNPYGAGGIRTPKSFRTHAFEACALAVLPPLQRGSSPENSNARSIHDRPRSPGDHHTRPLSRMHDRNGGPCFPMNAACAALLIGAPGFEPGTSASRTQRSTGLSHAPKNGTSTDEPKRRSRGLDPRITLMSISGRSGMDLVSLGRSRSAFGFARPEPTLRPPAESAVGSHPITTLLFNQRTEWDSNPRGLSPTRFPIVRLKPLGHPSRNRYVVAGTHSGIFSEDPVGSNSRIFVLFLRRREWDAPRCARRLRFAPPNPRRVLLRSPPWVLIPVPPSFSTHGGSGIRTHAGLVDPTP